MNQIHQKILFLDIDGVLELDKGFDKASVENLNFIIDKYNPYIVISSDQRIEYTNTALKKKLQKASVKANIKDFTTTNIRKYDSTEEKRYLEINDYIETHSIDDYVVIDDMSLGKYFKNRYIGTSYAYGFTKNNIKEIEKIWIK